MIPHNLSTYLYPVVLCILIERVGLCVSDLGAASVSGGSGDTIHFVTLKLSADGPSLVVFN